MNQFLEKPLAKGVVIIITIITVALLLWTVMSNKNALLPSRGSSSVSSPPLGANEEGGR